MKKRQKFFAKTFSDISSDKNYTPQFLLRKEDIEKNQKELFENITHNDENEKLKALNEPFDLHEAHRAIRDSKKYSAPGEDKISYEMLQNYQKLQ